MCGDPQADAEHLANHLAFSALLGDGRHEAWLDEHAADWETAGPEELAGRVVEHADDVEFPRVFENTVEEGAAGDAPGVDTGDAPGVGSGDVSRGETGDAIRGDPGIEGGTTREPEAVDGTVSNPGRYGGDEDAHTRRVLREARELTRRMYEEAGPDPDDSGEPDESTDSDH